MSVPPGNLHERSADLAPALPAPRLQFRWAPFEGDSRYGWACHYELVLPLREHDIRREVWEDGEQAGERSELVLNVGGVTKRGGSEAPCLDLHGRRCFDTPFRDGVHAGWDSLALGGLPIFVIDIDGTAIPEPSERKQARDQRTAWDNSRALNHGL